MKRRCMLILFLLISISIYANEDKQVFMVYGQDFMINYPLPNIWQVDMNFASRNRIDGFFYIKQFGINNSPVGIIMQLAKKPDEDSKLVDWVEYDKQQLLKYYPEREFQIIDNQRVQKYGYEVLVYEFKNKNSLIHYQNIAYIDSKEKYFIKIYIDCKSLNGNEQYVDDFLSGVFDISYLKIKVMPKN